MVKARKIIVMNKLKKEYGQAKQQFLHLKDKHPRQEMIRPITPTAINTNPA